MARDLSSELAAAALPAARSVAGRAGDSLMFRRIRAATRLVYLLDGTSLDLDPELAELAELRGRRRRGEFPAVTVERATAAMRSTRSCSRSRASAASARSCCCSCAAAHWNQRLLVIDGKRLAQLHAARAARRDPLARPRAHAARRDPGVRRHRRRRRASTAIATSCPASSARCSTSGTGPIAITINRERMPRIHQRPLVHLTLEVPPLARAHARCGSRSCRR